MRFKQLLSVSKGFYPVLFLIIIFVVLNRLTYSYVPLFTQYIIDILDVGTSTANFPSFITDIFKLSNDKKTIILIVASSLVFYQLLRFTMVFMEDYLRGRLTENISEKLRNRLYNHIQSLDYTYHNNADTGDLVQRVTSDIEAMSNFVSNRIPEFFRLFATVIFGAVQIFVISPTMVLVALSMVPISAIASVWFFKKVDKSFKVIEETESGMMTVIQENLSGSKIVRAFANESFEIEKLEKKNKKYSDEYLKFQSISSKYWGFSDTIAMLQYLVTIMIGVIFVRNNGDITGGQIIAVLMLLGMLIWPIRGLGRMIGDFGRALVSTQRIFEILEKKSEFEVNGTLTPEIKGKIEFKDVHFQFPDGKNSLLNGVSFKVEAGQTVAIIGRTGSGKTTIINLLSRMLETSSGDIFIDDVNIKNIEKHYLRKQMGIVLQEPFLFSKTVYDNIAISNPTVDRDNVLKAAQIAAIEKDISSFEKGYDTIVGERGTTLSGGQKQRVAIARILIDNKPILVFDDSLSAVDTETDMMIRNALNDRDSKSTTVIITHRITTAKQADVIVVLEEGKISDIGVHETLSKKPGLYQKLWEIQGQLEAEFMQLIEEAK
ncbi:ATP-binding cassette subfamily B protein [Acholeplasma morum]|uniref:ABC transporter ATP-binding protein n=1 Tax=Paracholeplasma morum TaxID=264637 RepID=UPI00195916AB|nr:ABC transporter ATP-binding protein [Paracholeplasma morum]MBM7452829.1 ATP-binding cassette subfamily B protein [Paracholeplasma morum]